MPVAWRLAGPVDAEALRRALELLVDRHEALRTRIRPGAEGRVQEIDPAARLELAVEDATDEDDARARVQAHAWRPFDLERGPVFRALLLRLADDRHVLALNLHHALGDGWSFAVLVRELSAAYAALVRGEEPALPPVPLQYADFAAWQREHLAGARLERELAYWHARLDGAPPLLALPTDRPRPPVQSFRGAAVPVALPAELAERARALARREGATPFMVLLAAYQALLGRLAGQDDVVVGTAVAGRSHAETEGIVGLFVNTLALRADLSGDPAFDALLAQVREATLGAFAHQDLPFEKLVEHLRVERSLAHAPVFQAMFALQNLDAGDLDLAGVEAVDFGLEQSAVKLDLVLTLDESPDGGLAGRLEYAADLFDRATAERIAAGYRLLLDAVLADPARALSTIDLPAAGDLPAVAPATASPPVAVDAADAQPRGELERAIAAVWREVLRIERVEMNANFFEIGGHSLLLATLQERLEAELGRSVAMVDLFRAPTIRSFAALLAEAGPAAPAARRGEDRGSARRAAMARRR